MRGITIPPALRATSLCTREAYGGGGTDCHVGALPLLAMTGEGMPGGKYSPKAPCLPVGEALLSPSSACAALYSFFYILYSLFFSKTISTRLRFIERIENKE